MKKTTRTYLVLALLVITSQIIGCSAGGGKVGSRKAAYTVGGNVSGLSAAGLAANKGLILQNNGGDSLTITGNGSFTFGGALPNGRDYKVIVLTPPEGMTCSVSNAGGTVNGADVTNVDVSCANIETTYTIGGTLSGLMSSNSLVLQNNGGNDITLNKEGSFTFVAQLKTDAAYNVTVATQPVNQSCDVINGSGTGTVNKAAVTTISVACVITSGPPELRLDFGIKQLKFHWAKRLGATHYRLFEKLNAGASPVQVGGDIASTELSKTLGIEAIHFYDWPNMSYLMKACDANGCSDYSNEVTLVGASAKAVGYFKASNTDANDYFGWAMALSADGQTLAVGAFNEGSDGTAIEVPNAANSKQANNAAPKSGAVYVYTRDSSSGNWSQQAYIKASNAGAGDLFGISVALSEDGNTLAVGAINEDGSATTVNGGSNESAVDAGAAYVFRRSGTIWTQEAYVKASNTGAGDGFGYKLALSGDGNTLAVGAIYEDSNSAGTPADNSVQDAGAVYVFTRSGTTWTQEQYLKASNPGAGDFFGYSVALNNNDGNTLVVGAIHEDGDVASTMAVPNDTAANAGAVYVFTRAAGVWTQQAYLKASNTEAGDGFGYSVALSGTGNTLAVGAIYEDSNSVTMPVDNSATDSGAVYVFTFSGSWAQQKYLKASNAEANDGFGSAVALNVEGDTLAVGAYHESGSVVGINGTESSNTAPTAGAAYVYSNVSAVWSQKAYVKASNTAAGDNFGHAVSLSRNNNSNQFKNTLAVGASAESSSSTGVGSARSTVSAPFAGAVYLY
ncbi:MAG: integrin [Gammaproteobacteria bacterium]|nr:integrin [Gammaproteobacteria bacterium]